MQWRPVVGKGTSSDRGSTRSDCSNGHCDLPGGAAQGFREGQGPDEIFLLGDNSVASPDSREFGPLQWERVLGRPNWVVWPLDWLRALGAE